MFVACWSLKGGSGTTVVAAGLACVLAARHPGGALFVDLMGDAPAVFGLPEPPAPGVADWLAAGAGAPPDGLARLERDAAPGVRLVPRGAGELTSDGGRGEVLAGLLGAERRPVIVDCGVLDSTSGPVGSVAHALAACATASLLVTRNCYLSLRRSASAPLRPSGVVLISEPGRALRAADVEAVTGAPVLAEIAFDPGIARAVDCGLLAQRLPRSLERPLRSAA